MMIQDVWRKSSLGFVVDFDCLRHFLCSQSEEQLILTASDRLAELHPAAELSFPTEFRPAHRGTRLLVAPIDASGR